MKWTKLVKKRYESILIGGTLFGGVLGLLAFAFGYLICRHFNVESGGLLSFFGALLVTVVAVIGNWHYSANRLMMIEAIETLNEIKEKLDRKD